MYCTTPSLSDCEQAEETTMSCTGVCVYVVYILSTFETEDTYSQR